MFMIIILMIVIYYYFFFLFRNMIKPNKVNIEEAVPKFTEYFKSVVDKLLDYNQTHIKQLYAKDLMNTTEELIEFSSNISKVNIK